MIFKLLAAVVVAALPSIGLACSCVQYESTEERLAREFQSASAVFVGYPTEIHDSNIETERFIESLQSVRFAVLESWKGPEAGREPFETQTETTCCKCGYRLSSKERHLVFAFRGPNGAYTLSSCSLVGPLEERQEIVEMLRSLDD